MDNISSSVKKYVEQKDVESVRTALTTIGYVADYDSYKRFLESTNYAKMLMDDLFEPDDNQEYDNSETVETYKSVIKLMMNNFSEKKYESAIKIGASAFGKQNEQFEKKNDSMDNDSSFSRALKNPMKLVIIILIVIGLITIIINLLK